MSGRASRLVAAALVLVGLAIGARAQTPPPGAQDDAAGRRILALEETLTGDLDAILERGTLRALVPYARTQFFLDADGRPRGISYEAVQTFAQELRDSGRTGAKRLRVLFVVVPRDELLTGLVEGRGDIATGSLTITPSRAERVDFTHPIRKGVAELLVTGPGGPSRSFSGEGQLAGQTVFVRLSSSYDESLIEANERLRSLGLAPIDIRAADENLDDGDLLEMVNAGLLPATVTDSHVSALWTSVLPDLVVHDEIPLATDRETGWAFRKDSPLLAAALDDFAKRHRPGTLYGNILLRRYFQSTRWVKSALAPGDHGKFQLYAPLFQKYGARYDFDWRLLAAQAYQESAFDPNARSGAGAIGLMQLLPSTAASPEVGIADVREPEPNVHAGAKYMRWIASRQFPDEGATPVDQHLIALAAYNAGPARVRSARRDAEGLGLDPNKWFDNVEVTLARRAGSEPVTYVSNIYKYFIAYDLTSAAGDVRARIREELSQEPESASPNP